MWIISTIFSSCFSINLFQWLIFDIFFVCMKHFGPCCLGVYQCLALWLLILHLCNECKQVQCAGSHLDLVQTRLTQVEKTLLFDDDVVDSVSVMEVLESVTEVKNEYRNLHKDIKEVQQLQKEMTASLQYQLRSMRQTFKVLKKRLESRIEPLPPYGSNSATPSPQHR